LFLTFIITGGAAWAAEPVPGDSCSSAGATAASAEGGNGHFMICQSGTWKSVYSFNASGAFTKLGNQSCASGQILKFNGTAWTCAADDGGGGLPSGAVMAFDLAACPAGWSEYTAARGRFLRGIDNGASNDPDGTRVPGSVQADAFQAHQHTYSMQPGLLDNPYNITGTRWFAPTPATTSGYVADGTNGTPRISSETRPKNVAVLFCRKD
jgi:hypothetical protein